MRRTLFDFLTIVSDKKNIYSDIYDVEKLSNLWRSNNKFLSDDRKLIANQLKKIFRETPQLDILYSYYSLIERNSKSDCLINEAILTKVLEIIAASSSPVETYEIMVNFVKNHRSQNKSIKKVYQATKLRMNQLRKSKEFSTNICFELMLLRSGLSINETMSYPICFKNFN